MENNMPTYAGGLGVLAGDVVRSSSDLRLPLVAVTLLSRKGYFRQEITKAGKQVEPAHHRDAPDGEGHEPENSGALERHGQTLADLVLERDTDLTQTFFVNRKTIPYPPEPIRSAVAKSILGLMRWDDKRHDHFIMKK